MHHEEWSWGDLNSQGLLHTILSRTRIPVPPHDRIIFGRNRFLQKQYALVLSAGIEPALSEPQSDVLSIERRERATRAIIEPLVD
jgi:hypothetical protein